jgi:hypothetical protein
MIVFLLVVWFGSGSSQSSFAVPNIESQAECERLAIVMQRQYPSAFAPTSVKCTPYRAAK